MQQFLSGLSEGTETLLVLSMILFAGFIMTRLTNTLNLPKVSGYILAGILVGPFGLNFIPKEIVTHMGFVSDLALAFIAFGVGKFFKKEVIMKTGGRILIITLFEALAAGVLVTLFVRFVFHLDWDFSLILGAIATATAPASTMMTINQYKAKGEFVNTLLQIVALDDVVCLMAFSIVAAVASGHESGSVEAADIMLPIVYNVLALLLGFFCGYFLSRLLIPARSKDNRLILAIAMLLGISGICAAADISPLLSCMVFGASYINLTRDKKLYRQINNFTPPVMSIFFIVSGMNLDVGALTKVGAIGVGYFVIRILGKYLGTYISCAITGTSREIRNYMGLALIPQAGVAIGLAFLGKRLLPEHTGNLLLTIILSSSVLYEMIGPLSAKIALFKSGSIHTMAPLGREEEENAGNGDEMEVICSEDDEGEDHTNSENGDRTEHMNSENDDRMDYMNCKNSGRADMKNRECGGRTDAFSGDTLWRPEDSENADTDIGESDGRFSAEDSADMEAGENGGSDEEAHDLLAHVNEVGEGVEDQEEDYDIELELKPEKTDKGDKREKSKKNGKGKKQTKKK